MAIPFTADLAQSGQQHKHGLLVATLRTESPSIFLDASSFPTYLGKIEATLLAG